MAFTYRIEQYQVVESKTGSQKTPYRRRLFSEQDAVEEARRERLTAEGAKKFDNAGVAKGKYVEITFKHTKEDGSTSAQGEVTKKKKFCFILDGHRTIFFKQVAGIKVIDAPVTVREVQSLSEEPE